jgi:hypothetical protein
LDFTMRLRRPLAAALSVAVLAGLVCVMPSAQAAGRPVVSVLGDSYARGCTAVCPASTPRSQSWWNYTASDLGWTVGTVSAAPGAGYARPSGWGETLLAFLRAHRLAANSNYVLLEGGLNDHDQNPDVVYAGTRAVIAEVRRQAPHAKIIVVGAFLPSTSLATSNYVRAARAIDRAAQRSGVSHMSGFMCAYPVDRDHYHPTVAGHRAIGHWVAQEIAQLR